MIKNLAWHMTQDNTEPRDFFSLEAARLQLLAGSFGKNGTAIE